MINCDAKGGRRRAGDFSRAVSGVHRALQRGALLAQPRGPGAGLARERQHFLQRADHLCQRSFTSSAATPSACASKWPKPCVISDLMLRATWASTSRHCSVTPTFATRWPQRGRPIRPRPFPGFLCTGSRSTPLTCAAMRQNGRRNGFGPALIHISPCLTLPALVQTKATEGRDGGCLRAGYGDRNRTHPERISSFVRDLKPSRDQPAKRRVPAHHQAHGATAGSCVAHGNTMGTSVLTARASVL